MPEPPRSRDAQHGCGVPRCLGHEVMHRLVALADMPGIDPRSHGFHTLALTGQTQSGDVGAQRLMAISVTEDPGQLVHVGGEAVGTRSLGCGHTSRLAAYPANPLTFLTQSY